MNKILIVEDEKEILDNIAGYLTSGSSNLQVFKAGGGEAALEVIEKEDISLVVSDIKMPGMSGLELLSKIRAEHSHIGVILMTGHKTDQIFREAEKSGVLHFLEKPFQLAHLKQLISQRLEKGTEGFAGTLKNIQMTDLIQMCCLSMLSMTLRVAKGDKEGLIYIHDGEIVHAQCGDMVGEEAFYRIASWEAGQFETLGEMTPPETSINSRWESLLMEASRQLDESKAAVDTNENIDVCVIEDEEDEGPVSENGGEFLEAPDRAYRILIVDDSAMMRKALSKILLKDTRIAEVETARNGEEALGLLERQDFDLITLDVNMPVMDGSTALKHIMLKNPCPVLIVSSLSDRSHDAILDFLCIGAVDFIGKPSGGRNLETMEKEIIDSAITAAGARMCNFKRIRIPKRSGDAKPETPDSGPCESLVVIRSGIGGYAELNKLLPFLPDRTRGCLLIVQDMPVDFETAFAAFLQKRCPMTVQTLPNKAPLVRGMCYVVSSRRKPELVHDGNRTGIQTTADAEAEAPPEGGIHLMAQSPPIPIDTLMVILSGVGDVLQEELHIFREMGGRVIIQEPSSSMVPQTLWNLQGTENVDAAVPPDTIAKEITRYLSASTQV
ncbi:MAG: response regulator [Desulfobacteraceae bacterium]|nr:response regulator [Desulfobacteraceae bacterium]